MNEPDPQIHPGTPADEAVAALFDAYGRRLYHTGLRLCGSATDAEDMVQEAFLNAYRAWGGYEGRAPVSAWLFRIAANACHRLHRRRAGEPAHPASIEQLAPMNDPTLAVPPDGDPAALATDRELQAATIAAIGSLPDDYRLPLIFKDLLELSVGDVAHALDLKPATVKTRVHRARLMLRRTLSEAWPQVDLPPAAYPPQVCLDLLEAKQEALDRGEASPVADEVICGRCRAVFDSLAVAKTVCGEISNGGAIKGLREALMDRIRAEKKSASS